MTKRMKILSAVALVLLGALTLAYMNRSNIIIAAVGFAQRMAVSPGPNRPVNWEDGGTWQGNGERPPNIVVILTDDMGFNDVSMYGGGLIETPHIDALADEGVLFANGYAGSAVCSTSRAMLLTGRYSTRFGFEFTPAPSAFGPILQQLTHVDPMPRKFRFPESQDDTTGNDLPFEARGLPPEEITLAEELRQSGYRTLHIGKWHLGRDTAFAPAGAGF